MSIDPDNFTTPRYEVWVRSTLHDGRGDSRFYGSEGDPGEPFSLRHTTEDVLEARRLKKVEGQRAYTAVEVKVRWVLDKEAYQKAVDLDQLATLKKKYPDV